MFLECGNRGVPGRKEASLIDDCPGFPKAASGSPPPRRIPAMGGIGAGAGPKRLRPAAVLEKFDP